MPQNDAETAATRCPWAEQPQIYIDYHDNEWGVPVYDDQRLFEFLTLETFQAGLSWLIVLRKREAFRRAFDAFDAESVARFDDKRIIELIGDASIIRNRRKIHAAVNNAQAFLRIRDESGRPFSDYIWSFVDGKPIVNRWRSMKEVPASTPLAETVSRDLKQRGFSFVGPTVIYAHMQATGMVNDHLATCFRHPDVLGE